MSKPTDIFKQCVFTQPAVVGHRTGIAWLPERRAVIGKVLRIDGRDGLWTVTEVWGARTYDWLLANEREYKSLQSIQGRGAIDD